VGKIRQFLLSQDVRHIFMAGLMQNKFRT